MINQKKMKDLDNIHFKNREDFRNWLEKNHDKSRGIWMIFYKKHTKKENITYDESVEEAICFGWIDSIMNRIDEETFRQRFSPRRENSNWSKSNKERALRLITQKKMTAAGYESIENAKRLGKWQHAYTSQSCPETPTDLQLASYRKRLPLTRSPWLPNLPQRST